MLLHMVLGSFASVIISFEACFAQSPCQPGFVVVGGRCIKDCPPLSADFVPNAIINFPSSDTRTQKTHSFQCKTGYKLGRNEGFVSCIFDAADRTISTLHWKADDSCVIADVGENIALPATRRSVDSAVVCSEPPAVDNAAVETSAERLIPGSRLRFSCRTGFQLANQSSASLLCQPDATWLIQGECRPIEPSRPTQRLFSTTITLKTTVRNLAQPATTRVMLSNVVNSLQLVQAARRGDVEQVVRLLPTGADIDSVDDQGWTGLMWAANNGHLRIAELLLLNADVNRRNTANSTALMFAAKANHADIVRLLIEAGAQVNVQNVFGSTALLFASQGGHDTVVQVLLAAGANASQPDFDGNTPLIWATRANQSSTVENLLSTRPRLALVNAKTKTDSMTALMFAAKGGYVAIATRLLATPGIDRDAQNDEGLTAADLATIYGNDQIVQLFN